MVRNRNIQKQLIVAVILLCLGMSSIQVSGNIFHDSEAINDSLKVFFNKDKCGIYKTNTRESRAFIIFNENQPPIAEFSWTPMSPDPGETILFNASDSYDPDGYIALYEWDWDNDGEYDENSTNPNASHAFKEEGWYEVTLRVTDNASATNKKTKWVRVGNQPPDKPYIDGPTVGEAGIEYNYTFVSFDSDGDDLFYFIDWGDDNDTGWFGLFPSGEEITRSHFWSENGTYEIRARAKDYWDESWWEFLEVRIGNNAPDTPSISGPTLGIVGVEYDYNFSLSDPDDDAMYIRVDWGSGTPGPWQGPYDTETTVKLKHTWDEQGTFTIRAQAKDIHNAESKWGIYIVTMSRNKVVVVNSQFSILMSKIYNPYSFNKLTKNEFQL